MNLVKLHITVLDFTGVKQVNAIFNFKLVRTRILLVFSVLLLLVVGFTTYTFFVNKNIKSEAINISELELPQLMLSQQLATTMSDREASAVNYITTGKQQYKEAFIASNEEAATLSDSLKQLEDSKERSELVNKAIQWSKLVQTEVFPLYEQGQAAEALTLLQSNSALSEEVRVGYKTLAATESDQMEQASKNIAQAAKNGNVRGQSFSLALLMIGIALALYTASFISKPVKTVTERMKQLADGNLMHDIENVNRLDEYGQLFNATANLNKNLRETLSSVNDVAQNVAANSEELAQSSNEVKLGTNQVSITIQQLAAGADIQAKKSTELSSTMQEFTANIQEATAEGTTLKHNSTNVQQLAHEGKNLMGQSNEQMAAINDIMQDAVTKVEGLYDQSKEITQLVQVIEAIADQTNLLALNAAIEAARAGEHGKGFAVVADEVRTLAEQVSHSVTNISAIVGRMQNGTGAVRTSLQQGYEQVQLGTEKISTTSNTFEHILSALDQLTLSVDTISTALSQIVVRTENINTSIEDVAAVSEQSATNVEQTAATVQQAANTMEGISQSAESLATMAEELNTQLKKFKL